MKTIVLSHNIDTVNEFEKRHKDEKIIICEDLSMLNQYDEFLLIVDYDSAASDFNKLISADKIPAKTIVLEKTPEIATGKMLISHNVKAYGNLRMLSIHYTQMISSVRENKVWTYPELTSALIKDKKKPSLNEDSIHLLDTRLSQKEKEIVFLILDGLSNDAIATKLSITTRTVKAHISSIFLKLHINDRVSLVILLK